MTKTKRQQPVLGRVVQHPIDQVEFFPAPTELAQVVARCTEVTALCPVTGQPDLYTVDIWYVPQGQIIESKSLKLYLWRFRDVGISCEDLAAAIARDLHDQSGCHVRVTATQQSRGGIALTASAFA